MNAGGINQKSLGDISKYVKKNPNRYNNTYARTVWGNSDIAIRMDSLLLLFQVTIFNERACRSLTCLI